MIAADSQQRSREQGELMPGDCGGRLKKEKRMVISAPSSRGKDLSQQCLHDVACQERIGLGMTLWPTGLTRGEGANEI